MNDNTTDRSQYAILGIDARKTAIRGTFSGDIDNDYPGAWVNIIDDPSMPGWSVTHHMDGDGSKSVQRLLMYQVTGNSAHLAGMVDDAVSMNTGDIAASGFVDIQYWTDVLNLNAFNVDKHTLLEQVRRRFVELRTLYRTYGIHVYWLGGETGDLPHQVHSSVFDVAVHARTRTEHLITGNVHRGDRIWGFASDGKAIWEHEPNSGLMSNGLTLARVVLMNASYPQRYPKHLLTGVTYRGRFMCNDHVHTLGTVTVGEALTSPTRQWAILIKILVDLLRADNALHLLHGISMNTGGGASKVAHLGAGGVVYRKVMPTPPPIFQLVQQEANEDWQHMYTSFNCGVGLDIVGDVLLDSYLEKVAYLTKVRLFSLGNCDINDDPRKNKVIVYTPYGTFIY